jgi:hypothetical protein
MTALLTPTVNLNGTAKHDLVRQCMDVMHALENAEQIMARGTPHGRDYSLCPLTGERLDARARDAWHERMRAVHAMVSEFGELAIAINSQG